MPTDLGKLIAAINRVGIQNVSLLSRMTGMPTETIRYTMKKRFPNMGLKVRTPLNHAALGLERYFVSMRLSEVALKSEPSFVRGLSTNAFLTYWCTAAIERRQLAFFSVPVTLVDEFRGFLDRLVKEGILVEFYTERIEWSRNPELKSGYYDFWTGEWSVDWDRVRKSRESPPEPVASDEPSPTPDVDATDVLIVKELELDSWRNIAEIARKLRLNERTVRWHYRKHIADIVHSNYVAWTSVTPKERTKALGLIHEFNGVSKPDIAKLRDLFNNFPFAWFEGGRRDGYYQVHSALPGDYFMEALRFVNAGLEGVVEEWKTWTIDLSSTSWYTLPYENFDEKRGWYFDQKAALEAVMPPKMKIKQGGP